MFTSAALHGNNLRLARNQTDNLEADLWKWRTKCRASGKKIPKRLVQARAKWAFQKQGISEFKASDGWYWKWLAKWKKKSKMMAIENENSNLSKPLQIQQEEEEIKGKNNNSHSPILQMECEQKEEQSGAISPANLSTLVADNRQEDRVVLQDQEECCSNISDSSPISPEMESEIANSTSFWLSPSTPSSLSNSNEVVSGENEVEEDLLNTLCSSHLLFSTDILPLVMNDGEFSLDTHPTQSTLPVSPIFICSSEEVANNPSQLQQQYCQQRSNMNKKSLQDHIMPVDLALVNYVQDLEALFAAVTETTEIVEDNKKQNQEMVLTAVSNEALWTAGPSPSPSSSSSRSSSSYSNNWSPSPAESLKENFEPDPPPPPLTPLSSCGMRDEPLTPLTTETLPSESDKATHCPQQPKKKLTVIAKHRRLGEESLSRLKEEVRKYALDHTFKETAKKFGIHHSTVSGWVKARERGGGLGLLKCIGLDVSAFSKKADEAFIGWLKSSRENGSAITLAKVKDKVAELFQTFGVSSIEKNCKWFLLWNNRREEKQYVEGMEDEEVCRRETPNLAYPPAFKLEVALHAKKYSQYAAAKIFSVARRRIFDWMRQIPKLQELIAKGHMKKMTGRGPKNRDIDQALYEWYSQRRAAGERPRSCEVQARARDIYTAGGYTDMKCSYGWFKRWSQRFHIQLRYSYDDELLEWILARFDANSSINHHDLQNHGLKLVRKEDPHFKASSGWALRFCKRHADYLSPDYSIGAKLPEHLEERSNRFKVVLQQLIKEKYFGPSEIGCMDELPLNLSPGLRDKRIGSTAPGGILLKHHGLKGAQAVVILAMTANGKLLPPFLVLKGDEKSNSLNLPGCEVRVMFTGDTNNNSSMDSTKDMVLNEQIMSQWLNSVWFSNVPSSSLLIADSFQSHTNPVSQKFMVSRGACLAIIPSACSQKLQPLHRGMKLKFKEFVECMYLKSLDSSTSDAKPSNGDVLSWVDQAYKMLKQQKDEIEASFHETEILAKP